MSRYGRVYFFSPFWWLSSLFIIASIHLVVFTRMSCWTEDLNCINGAVVECIWLLFCAERPEYNRRGVFKYMEICDLFICNQTCRIAALMCCSMSPSVAEIGTSPYAKDESTMTSHSRQPSIRALRTRLASTDAPILTIYYSYLPFYNIYLFILF